jgi:hypothetical protein
MIRFSPISAFCSFPLGLRRSLGFLFLTTGLWMTVDVKAQVNLDVDFLSGGETFVDKNGTGLTVDFSFELGVFADGFVPTLNNMAQWESNWRKLVLMTDESGWEPGDPSLNSGLFTLAIGDPGMGQNSSLLYSDGSGADTAYGFSVGQQVYLWSFNDKNLVDGTEWSLITRTVGPPEELWVIPDAFDEESDGQFILSLINADTAIIGMLHNTIADSTIHNLGVGAGFDAGVAFPDLNNEFGIVTYDAFAIHQFMQGIPEPSRAIFLVIGLLGMSLRRRRA